MSAQFDDGKEEGALRTIGEVSRALSIKTHVLRYWEQQFPMLEPLKRSGGRRYYRMEDIELIEQIDDLVNGQGYTLKGAQQVIEGGKPAGMPDADQIEGSLVDAEDKSEELTASPDEEETNIEASPIAQGLPAAPDGGVDAFFGKAEEVQPEQSGTVEVEKNTSAEVSDNVEPAGPSRAEILAQLKAMRSRLSQALAA